MSILVNVPNIPNIPIHLRKTYESLSREQKEIYDGFPHKDKMLLLEGLAIEQNKSVCLLRIFVYCQDTVLY